MHSTVISCNNLVNFTLHPDTRATNGKLGYPSPSVPKGSNVISSVHETLEVHEGLYFWQLLQVTLTANLNIHAHCFQPPTPQPDKTATEHPGQRKHKVSASSTGRHLKTRQPDPNVPFPESNRRPPPQPDALHQNPNLAVHPGHVHLTCEPGNDPPYVWT